MDKIMVIYGHCSDLIEFEVKKDTMEFERLITLESNTYWQDEISVEDGMPDTMEITLKDGTVFNVSYDDDGIWRINIVKMGLHFIKLIKNEDREQEQDRELYSDWLIMSPFRDNPIIIK